MDWDSAWEATALAGMAVHMPPICRLTETADSQWSGWFRMRVRLLNGVPAKERCARGQSNGFQSARNRCNKNFGRGNSRCPRFQNGWRVRSAWIIVHAPKYCFGFDFLERTRFLIAFLKCTAPRPCCPPFQNERRTKNFLRYLCTILQALILWQTHVTVGYDH